MEPISSMAATVAAVVIALGPTFMWTTLVAYVVAKIAGASKEDDLENDKRLLQHKVDEQIKEISCLKAGPTTKDPMTYEFECALQEARMCRGTRGTR